ncbi:seryl-tRNA synthetase, partial [Lecanoromycetidae sp. Uapishka_2]
MKIKDIRQNPELYSNICIERNYKALRDNPFLIVKLFDEWLQSQKKARGLREKSNVVRSKLSHAKTFSGLEAGSKAVESTDREELLREARSLKEQLSKIEARDEELSEEIDSLAAELPNLTSHETPKGEEPQIIGYINERRKHSSTSKDLQWKSHVHIGNEFDLLDFSGAATTSGWGWYYLKNEAALLEQALIQYALKIAMERGFKVCTPPSMVYTHMASACGFRPRDQNGEQQIYTIRKGNKDELEDESTPSHSLAGTAEIPFASMKANMILDHADLPICVIGPSRCYRAEAGARGAGTKGLYRVHEFTKVEMLAWTSPGAETDMFQSMLAIQKEILKSLGLHCRILEMPSTDLGSNATRKQDIEAYFPSRQSKNDGWGEVTSASICTDYQTRRMNTRVKGLTGSLSKTDFPSTINATAVAVPRVLAALLENGWDDQGSVRIPEVLWPWMHGIKKLTKKR